MATKMARKFTASAVLKARMRNSETSIIGSASVCWRRTHRAAVATPTAIVVTAPAETPACAMSLRP